VNCALRAASYWCSFCVLLMSVIVCLQFLVHMQLLCFADVYNCVYMARLVNMGDGRLI
jgi:hypothetical protein